jgi:hypothetical protein
MESLGVLVWGRCCLIGNAVAYFLGKIGCIVLKKWLKMRKTEQSRTLQPSVYADCT